MYVLNGPAVVFLALNRHLIASHPPEDYSRTFDAAASLPSRHGDDELGEEDEHEVV